MGESDLRREYIKCSESPAYFIHNYSFVYDAVKAKWIPFRLWPAQYRTLKDIDEYLLCVILKARQLGLTWLCLGYILWKMLYRPSQTVLLFSRREPESIYLLRNRLHGMYNHLPEWMKVEKFLIDSSHEWQLDNGSIAYAFPTTAGDSYTASIVLVDEADLIEDLAALMNAVKPTIDAGGQMILLSRSNKDEPNSPFKKYYRAAKAGENEWHSVFLPWNSRIDRTPEWYETQKLDILTRTGSLDDLWQQYPETDAEALAPKTQSKRIPPQWVNAAFYEIKPIKAKDAPAYPGLRVYQAPVTNGQYVLGCDPAEGNPTSDDSTIEVLNYITGEECAVLSGKIQPGTIAEYAGRLSDWYNNAGIMVEKNNHGHVVIKWLMENGYEGRVLRGLDGDRGWTTSGKSKAAMYTTVTEVFRDQGTLVHSFETYMQLTSVDGSTLKAPKGEYDDRAVAFSLALVSIHMPRHKTVVYRY